MTPIEIGFSTVRVQSGNNFFSFSSSIAEETGSMLFGTASPGIYDFEGRKYLIGDRALARSEQNYKLELEWLIETAPLFVHHALTLANREDEDILVVGLPPEYFFNHQKSLRNRLSSYVIDGKLFSFKQVYVVPQGVASFVDFCEQNRPLENDVSLLVDIGANTLNTMLAHGEMVYPEESVQFSRCGACIPAREVIAQLRRNDITISQTQAHQILKTGKFDGKELIDLPDIIRSFARQTIDRIYNQYASHTLTRVILSGGGSLLIKDHLPDSHHYSQKLCFVQDPLFSNVRGYNLIGLRLMPEHNL